MSEQIRMPHTDPRLPDANERRMQQAWDVFQRLQERDAHLAAELSYCVLTIAESFAVQSRQGRAKQPHGKRETP